MFTVSAIARALSHYEVDTVFGLVGDGNLFVVESLVRENGVRYISATHEAGATLMADAYSRVTGRLGVATITHGPGLTNAVTALTEASRNGSRLLVLCGDTSRHDRQHYQDIAQREVISPTGAGFEEVRSAESAAADVAEALRRVIVEHRPIVLNLPYELSFDDVDAFPILPRLPQAQAFTPDPAVLDQAVGLIASSRRSIIVAGRGAVESHARDDIVGLADRLGAPLFTTLLAKDFFVGEPFNMGIFGTLASAHAADVIAETDCIIVFGAGLNKWTTSRGGLVTKKRVVQCDVNSEHIGRWTSVEVGVVGDAGATARAISSLLDEAEFEPAGFASSHAQDGLVVLDELAQYHECSVDDCVDIRSAMLHLDQTLPVDRTVVTDGGRFVSQPFKYLRIPEPSALVYTTNFSSIGLAMAAAVGAGIGRPDRTVVAILGDGGFMMGGMGEFNSAVRHNVDLIAVVLNDSAYGAELTQLHERNLSPDLAHFNWPELAPIAEALGGRGFTVRNRADLEGLDEIIIDRDRPLLIDIKLDPNAIPALGK